VRARCIRTIALCGLVVSAVLLGSGQRVLASAGCTAIGSRSITAPTAPPSWSPKEQDSMPVMSSRRVLRGRRVLSESN
jgi:hypothetical protein